MSATHSGYGTPVRHPDSSSPTLMTRRAFWLVALSAFIPGSAQVLAGNRRLGRFALATTILLWVVALVALALWVFWRSAIFVGATNAIALLAAQVILGFYAVLWVVLMLDTLRLARLVKVAPVARLAVAGLSVVLIVGLAGGAAWGSYLAGVARSAIGETFVADRGFEEPIDGRYNILLLGGDAGPDRLGLRPDSISVVSIDAETGATTIIGVPRNLRNAPFSDGSPLWGAFPNGYNCGQECLISYLHTYGQENPELYPETPASNPGIEATRDAVEGAVGLELQYYVLIDMQGFADMVDALGGVDITVAEDVPLGVNGQKQTGVIEAGEYRMDGALTLEYVRARYNTTDYERMERQRQVQAAILAQFEPATVLTKFEAIARAGTQLVQTDISQSMLGRFVELGGKARALELTRLELVPPLVDTENPDYARIHAEVDAALIVPTPSPTPQ